MKKPRSISEVINGSDDYEKLLAVSKKSRKRKKRVYLPPPIGHHLALIIEGETHFIDNIDICNSHTSMFIDSTHIVVFPFCVESVDLDQSRLKIYYKNNTEIEIIRIS